MLPERPIKKPRRTLALLVGLLACAGVGAVFAATAAATPAPAVAAARSLAVAPPPGIDGDPIAAPVNPPADPGQAALISRGAYLATAGDCAYCHSVPGGRPYAGGQAVQTPFGALVSPNITPDKTYGIGNWSDAEFYAALHDGVGRGRSLLLFPNYLYPVMPWAAYSKLSRPDIMAIRAYLASIAPVAQANQPSQIGFPFNVRAGMLAWRILFFHPGPVRDDPSWSPQVRNGAYLVEALEHCQECHTQRNLLMATMPSRYLAGGAIPAQSWYAPNISGSKTDGIGGWSSDELFNFLYRGGALGVTGGPYGPMKDVVDQSLSRLPASDVHDIVAYLQAGVPGKPDQASPVPADAVPASAGAALYADNCARCHGDNGEGVIDNFPNLAGNQSVWNGAPVNVISMILGGFYPWHTDQSAMPAFRQSLSDGQIAAIANYVRTAWGNRGVADATAGEVAGARGLASTFATLSTGNTTARLGASLNSGAGAEGFDDISGKLELYGDHINCMISGRFTSADPDAAVKTVSLAGSCSRGGGGFHGFVAIDGKTYPADLSLRQTISGGQIAQVTLYGRPTGAAQAFSATIALATTTD